MRDVATTLSSIDRVELAQEVYAVYQQGGRVTCIGAITKAQILLLREGYAHTATANLIFSYVNSYVFDAYIQQRTNE